MHHTTTTTTIISTRKEEQRFNVQQQTLWCALSLPLFIACLVLILSENCISSCAKNSELQQQKLSRDCNRKGSTNSIQINQTHRESHSKYTLAALLLSSQRPTTKKRNSKLLSSQKKNKQKIAKFKKLAVDFVFVSFTTTTANRQQKI